MQNKIKSKKSRASNVGWICVAAAVVCAGCSTEGYHKSNAAAMSMQTAAQEVRAESQALELTMEGLRNLVNEPGADLRRPYKHFSSSLAELVVASNRTETTGKRMEERSAAYLQAWDRQLGLIDFDHVREVSQSRKTEVANHFEAVARRYQESQAVMKPLISYLQDIKHALNTDLTSPGLESMKGVAQNASDNAAKVHVALDALISELSNSSSRMSSIAYQQARPNQQGRQGQEN